MSLSLYRHHIAKMEPRAQAVLSDSMDPAVRKLQMVGEKRFSHQPRAVHIAALFLIGAVVLFLRNADPVLFPILYAEDGMWTSVILKSGVWEASLTARPGFPVLGIILLQYLGLKINMLFFGMNLTALPVFYAAISYCFLSALAILPIILFKSVTTLPTRLALYGITLLMPLGGDGNEIIGRLLNLGFLFPVLAAYIVAWRLIAGYSLRRELICAFVLFLSAMTTPVAFGIAVLYLFLCFWAAFPQHGYPGRRWSSGLRGVGIWGAVVTVVSVVSLGIAMLPPDVLTYKGGADLPLKASALIELTFARIVFYPLLAPVYPFLNDFVVVGIVIGFSVWLRRHLHLGGAPRSDWVILAALFGSLAIFSAALLAQRIGLSSLFNHYQSTFPDRYFYGTNLLFCAAVLMVLDHHVKQSNGLKDRIGLVWILVLTLTMCGRIFEFDDPIMKWHELGTFGEAVKREANPSTRLLVDAHAPSGIRLVPIYPVWDNYAWRMELPIAYFDATSHTP